MEFVCKVVYKLEFNQTKPNQTIPIPFLINIKTNFHKKEQKKKEKKGKKEKTEKYFLWFNDDFLRFRNDFSLYVVSVWVIYFCHG